MTHQYGNSGNDVVICRVGNFPEYGISLHIKVDIWHPAVGLMCGNPPRHLNQLKTWAISLMETPSGQELCRPWYIFHEILIETPPLYKAKFKYQSWYLTPCCGLEVQKPTQALQSVKGPGNTLDWHPKWSRTLPSLIYFSWDIYRDHPSIIFFSNIKVHIWHPTVVLRCRNPSRHLNQLKTRAIPLT